VSDLPEEAYAAVIAGFDRMTLDRLNVLLDGTDPSSALAMILGDQPPTGLIAPLFDTPGLVAAWRDSAVNRTPERVWEDCLRLDVSVFVRGRPGYPHLLVSDPAPAPVLFVRGSFDRLAGRRVGIIGTRNATGSGRNLAVTLGRDLAEEGVHVVSGLARGIDGCAHRGALSVVEGARPVAVVASGLDVVYPREHRDLWNLVAERGVLISEAVPGTPPEPYRFPLRNRIIAALSEILVVVESRETGGSLLTVREAAIRGVQVMAVPGAVGNRAAMGTNDLLRDGCAVVTGVDDVMSALQMDSRRAGAVAYDSRPRPKFEDKQVLAMCCEPRTLDQLTILTSRSLVECAMTLARLEDNGWVKQSNGWFEADSSNTTVL
jgi:DNA processing protein